MKLKPDIRHEVQKDARRESGSPRIANHDGRSPRAAWPGRLSSTTQVATVVFSNALGREWYAMRLCAGESSSLLLGLYEGIE